MAPRPSDSKDGVYSTDDGKIEFGPSSSVFERAVFGYRTHMSILAWIVVGLIAGILAKYAVPGEGPGGILGDIVVGIVGAIVGGWIFHAVGYAGASGINVWSIVVAFVGAVIFLLILRAITGRRAV